MFILYTYIPIHAKKYKKGKSTGQKRDKKEAAYSKIADIEPMEVSDRNLLVDAAINEMASALENRAKDKEEAKENDEKKVDVPKDNVVIKLLVNVTYREKTTQIDRRLQL